MNAPHVANVVVVYHADPRERLRWRASLGARGARVFEPAPGWIAAETALPGSGPCLAAIDAAGFVFVEGRDRLLLGERSVDRDLRRLARAVAGGASEIAGLPGDFTFVHCESGGRATLVRSAAGLAPLYVHDSGELILIASSLAGIVRHLPREPELDPLVACLWTQFPGVLPHGRSLFRGVALVPHGSLARVSSGSVRVQQYWDAEPSSLSPRKIRPTAEHSAELRELLLGTLRHELDARGRNLLLLSGGVDSSTLAAVTARELEFGLSTVSFLPWQRDLRAREKKYIDAILRHVTPQSHTEYVLDLDEVLRLRRAAPRVPSPVFHVAAGALAEIRAHDSPRVLFCGSFADHVCGSVDTLPVWADQTRSWDLLHGLPRLPGALRVWGSVRVRRLSRRWRVVGGGWLPPFIRRSVRDEARALCRSETARLASDRSPFRLLLRHVRMVAEVLPLAWETTTALGVRRVYPFFTREMVELACRCHPLELIGQGPKALLRDAVQGLVPSENLSRPDKGLWSFERGLARWWKDPLPPELAGVLAPEHWPRPPGPTSELDVLRLTELVNIVDAARTSWQER